MSNRHPLSPAEFDAACRLLIAECPWLSETSGKRSVERNESVGGHPDSKHVLGMARDFVSDQRGMEAAQRAANRLGLWTLLHDVGSGSHLHTQGLATGPVPNWWMHKYG